MKTFKSKKMTCKIDCKSEERLENKKCNKVKKDNQMIVVSIKHKTIVVKVDFHRTQTRRRLKRLSNRLTQS